MSPVRTLAAIAALTFAAVFAVPAAANAAVRPQLLTYCGTVNKVSGIFTTAGGTTRAGTARVGDIFENINAKIQGSWRYGDDENNGVYGWINDGSLNNLRPCD